MRALQKNLNQEIKRIAKKNNVTEETIKEIESLSWKFIKEKIKEGNRETEEFPNIYLRFLGTIFVAPNKIRKINKNVKIYEST